MYSLLRDYSALQKAIRLAIFNNNNETYKDFNKSYWQIE